jgi:hypothetical protein
MNNTKNDSLAASLERVAQVMTNLGTTGIPALGLDLDGVLDESPIFFRLLTAIWPGKVIIITFRSDRAKAEADLANIGIRYDELVLVESFGQKAEVIVEKGVMVYFDDQPEMLQDVPPTVTVLLFRNEGNFDFEDRKWILSNQTGKLI